jgi:hypothetical protein
MNWPAHAGSTLPRLALCCTLALAACDTVDDASLAAPEPALRSLAVVPGTLTDGTLVNEVFKLCKEGADATFDLHENGAATPARSLEVLAGTCVFAAEAPFDPSTGITHALLVTAVENVPAGFQVDSVRVLEGNAKGTTTTTLHPQGTTSVSASIGGSTSTVGLRGAVVTFFNSPLPPPEDGDEGCTPGYWKQRQHFDSWVGFLPTQSFASAGFEDAFPGLTLLQVLSNGGGGLDALGRHAVAALLNAANGDVDFGKTTADIIAAFNAVHPGDKAAYNALKDEFEKLNERGCPLN